MPRQATSLLGYFQSRVTSVFWSAVANALPRGALLVSGIYVARTAGHASFADYSLAVATVTLGGGMFGTALMNLGSKRVPELAHRTGVSGAGFASLLAFGGALALATASILLVLAPGVAALLGRGVAFGETLSVAAAAVLAIVIHGSLNGLVLGSARFATAGLSALVGAAAFAAALVPFTARWGTSGALAAIAVLYLVMSALLTLPLGPDVSRDIGRPGASRKLLWQWGASIEFLAPIVFYIAVFPVVVWLANLMLARGPDPTLAIARFNAAYNWYAIATFVPSVMNQVEFVHLSRARARGEGQTFLRLFRYSVLQNAVVMAVLVGVGLLLSSTLMALFRVDDAAGRLCLRLLFIAAYFVGVGLPFILMFTIIDQVWVATALNFAWGALTLTGAWLLRDLGAVGLGVAFAVAYAFHLTAAALLAVRFARRLVGSERAEVDAGAVG